MEMMQKGKSKKPTRVHKATLRELAEAEITPEERYELIAETAYYRAEQRGFEGNEHLQDWYEAEKLIDSQLHKAATNQADIAHEQQ
jgi:hypothetical protein